MTPFDAAQFDGHSLEEREVGRAQAFRTGSSLTGARAETTDHGTSCERAEERGDAGNGGRFDAAAPKKDLEAIEGETP